MNLDQTAAEQARSWTLGIELLDFIQNGKLLGWRTEFVKLSLDKVSPFASGQCPGVVPKIKKSRANSSVTRKSHSGLREQSMQGEPPAQCSVNKELVTGGHCAF